MGATGFDELVALLGAWVDGDAAAARAALCDGTAEIVNPLGFPLPVLRPRPVVPGAPRHRLVVTDRLPASGPSGPGPVTRLVPPTLVVGLGSARGVSATAVIALLARVRDVHGFDLRAVRAYASVDARAEEPGIRCAIAPATLHTYPAEVLARVPVPNPSEVVRAGVGTAGVAEAAALHRAGERGELVVEKIKGKNVTVAVARIRPR